jgi:hypothetical protein
MQNILYIIKFFLYACFKNLFKLLIIFIDLFSFLKSLLNPLLLVVGIITFAKMFVLYLDNFF